MLARFKFALRVACCTTDQAQTGHLRKMRRLMRRKLTVTRI